MVLSSDFRIPFDKVRGDKLRARDELKGKIVSLGGNRPSGMVLVGEYISEEPTQGSDIENILFYNIDQSGVAFAGATTQGMRFLHTLRTPEPTDGPGRLHQYRYRFCPVAAETMKISFEFEMENLDKTTTAGIVWREASLSLAKCGVVGEPVGGAFKLAVHILVPEKKDLFLAKMVKPLLDGTISALQEMTFEPRPELLARLSTLLNIEPSEIKSLLGTSESKILGKRKILVFPFGKGVKWNPEDERLKECDISIGKTKNAKFGIKVLVGGL